MSFLSIMEPMHHYKKTHAALVLVLASFVFLLLVASTRASHLLGNQEKALLHWKSTLQTQEPLCSWTPPNNPCNWTGITCNRRLRSITEINLEILSVVGNLDGFNFSAFSSLIVLDLGYNQLNGTIPPTIRFSSPNSLYLVSLAIASLEASHTRSALSQTFQPCSCIIITFQVPFLRSWESSRFLLNWISPQIISLDPSLHP